LVTGLVPGCGPGPWLLAWSRRHVEQIREVIREMHFADSAHGKLESLLET